MSLTRLQRREKTSCRDAEQLLILNEQTHQLIVDRKGLVKQFLAIAM